MQYLCILFFVSLCQGLVAGRVLHFNNSMDNSEVPLYISTLPIDTDVTLMWPPVTNNDPKDPVLGYKLKVSGKQIDKTDPPITKEITAFTDKTNYTVKFSLPGKILYELRVRAFTKTKELGLSRPWKFYIITF